MDRIIVPEAPGRSTLPALLQPTVVAFPGLMAPLRVQEASGIAALEAAAARQEPLALFWERGEGIDSAPPIGVSCGIVRLIRLPDGQMQVILQGIARVRRLAVTGTEPHLRVLVETVQPSQVSIVGNPLREAVLNSLRAVAQLSAIPEQALVVAANAEDAGQLADIAAGMLDLPAEDRQRVLDTIDPIPRLEFALQLAEQRRGYLEISQRIQREVGERAGREQRAYVLREQLRAIRRELGELDPSESQVAELRRQVEGKGLPAEVRAEAERELGRLEAINPASPEWAVIRTRLDWILALPWADPPPDTIDLEQARRVLDADHLGLEKVKDRILDYLAVARLRGGARGPILCLVGPPGVGKTSLGQSIARALNRPFVRASLGGVRDEAEIRGHRRTYVGALPGRIIQGMRRAGARNPVFMLDEVDKLGASFQGDPAAALLEVLDPAQNHAFLDHYLDLPYDLSRVFFICTANVTFSIPEALLDRMEVIEIPGYTDQEKLGIARRHLLPRQMEEHGLPEGALQVSDELLLAIVRGWTR